MLERFLSGLLVRRSLLAILISLAGLVPYGYTYLREIPPEDRRVFSLL